jgi:integrase
MAGLVPRNVARLVRPPRVPHAEMRTLTNEQARTLIDAAGGERLGALYVVALASGARLGELLALRWQDVDTARSTIRITRTLTRTDQGVEIGETKTASSRRSVPLGRAAMAALQAHRIRQAEERLRTLGKAATHDLVFGDEVGRPIDGTHVAHTFHGVLVRIGLPRIRFHDLRHTAATLLLEAGMHPRVVAERLGHSTPALVMNTYGHVTERMQTEATAILDRVLRG